jgi:hypothetical protein
VIDLHRGLGYTAVTMQDIASLDSWQAVEVHYPGDGDERDDI